MRPLPNAKRNRGLSARSHPNAIYIVAPNVKNRETPGQQGGEAHGCKKVTPDPPMLMGKTGLPQKRKGMQLGPLARQDIKE